MIEERKKQTNKQKKTKKERSEPQNKKDDMINEKRKQITKSDKVGYFRASKLKHKFTFSHITYLDVLS